ncbi:hypothetical protein [Mesobacillus subterraneus]|uniref:hypothetical protein n=1 Tax=Mesobacillus subterraneus TaxID=285983 RepID=UPI001CFF1C69|nr:hypothetical protein [Mesobacillus subterraneus]
MVKTIKFNLFLDGKQVRNLDDLKENFNIDDLLEYYHSGLLGKWLSVRGYNDIADKVTDIPPGSQYEIAENLIKLFNMEIDQASLSQSIYSLTYHAEKEEALQDYHKNGSKVKELIEQYHQGYLNHYMELLDNPDDLPLIKAVLKSISEDYIELFRLNAEDFFDEFIEEAPLVIFAVLLNTKIRDVFLEHSYIQEELSNPRQIADLTDKISDHIEYCSDVTGGYWKDLEPADKKIMVIHISDGDLVRNLAKIGEELTQEDIIGKFPILNGLDYKSNDDDNYIEYMEV